MILIINSIKHIFLTFYLFGIPVRPTEKLAAQIILFAFQTIFFLFKKSESCRNFDHVRRVCSRLYLFQISIVKRNENNVEEAGSGKHPPMLQCIS
jgi:hypothetical protein